MMTAVSRQLQRRIQSLRSDNGGRCQGSGRLCRYTATTGILLGTPLQQAPHVLDVATEGCVNESRAPLRIKGAHAGAILEKATQGRVVPIEGNVHEGGPSALIGCFNVRTMPEQVSHNLQVA
eukprot:CAMPEP_0180795784 /NCGR_PEP_ID=MMETSP1038_2-20121128/56407_1 /TAXON_ID=632150 /ORGANISM="Azadinium spinosum, Strain 3D9" /LENGTH=121 /DNA_ID=CAMNT_0022834773 /DNA_START=38 /DNA_END=400 /DNA_ORIENTATION=-